MYIALVFDNAGVHSEEKKDFALILSFVLNKINRERPSFRQSLSYVSRNYFFLHIKKNPRVNTVDTLIVFSHGHIIVLHTKTNP